MKTSQETQHTLVSASLPSPSIAHCTQWRNQNKRDYSDICCSCGNEFENVYIPMSVISNEVSYTICQP